MPQTKENRTCKSRACIALRPSAEIHVQKRAQELFPSSWAHNVISAKWNADGIQNLQTAHPGKAWGKRGAMKTYRIHQKRRIQSRILSAHATFQNAFLITGPAAGNRLEQGTNIQLGHAVFRTFWDRQRGRLLKKMQKRCFRPTRDPPVILQSNRSIQKC